MPTGNAREPLPPAKRRRLQQIFEHASKAAEASNYEYAFNLFTQCVVGDPGNRIYVQQFLSTLSRKYNNNPKSVGKLAGITSVGAKTSLKKASMQKDWPAVIKAGIEVLKGNPWDVATLMAMATACEGMDLAETQLVYLKMALDVNQKDPDVNRMCGRALARMGHFDQAISCWHRVEQAKPGDEEAQRAIADLAVERTISHGGYEEAESSTDVRKGATRRTTVPNSRPSSSWKNESPNRRPTFRPTSSWPTCTSATSGWPKPSRCLARPSKCRGATSPSASGWKTSSSAATATRSWPPRHGPAAKTATRPASWPRR